jgi:hypothetical protein
VTNTVLENKYNLQGFLVIGIEKTQQNAIKHGQIKFKAHKNYN